MGAVRTTRSTRARRIVTAVAVAVACALIGASTGTLGHSVRPVAAASIWNETTPPTIKTYSGSTQGVSCIAPTSCVAVGWTAAAITADRVAWAARLQNGSWTTTSFPTVGGNTLLNDISCSGPMFCVAVGGEYTAPTWQTFVQHWNGTAWKRVTAPSPSALNELMAVSCTSPSHCVAVGRSYDSGSSGLNFIVEWDGTAWHVASTPTPQAAKYDLVLNDVSCPSAHRCVAVGEIHPTVSDLAPFIEHWDGSAWAMDLPAPTAGTLSSVSCPDANTCTAVGDDGVYVITPPHAVVQRWNGAAWTIAPAPDAGVPNIRLRDVSCPTTDVCVAVGQRGSQSYLATFDTTTWTTQSPAPGGFARSLWAVSCPSALSCTAAGEQTDASGFVPLTYSNVAAGQTRTVTVSWDASESARLAQLAAYFGESPAATQKRSVYLLSFLLGFLPPTPQPQVLPPPGTTTTVVSVWDAGEFSVIDTVAKKYVLSDSDATRLSFSILSFLLGLGGI